jgi:hypothetical protein
MTYRFLLEGGAAPTLVIGVGRVPAEIVGHAWVLLNGLPAGESAASVSPYLPTLVFGPDGLLIRSEKSVESALQGVPKDAPDRLSEVRWT